MRKNAISHALVKYGMVLFVPNPILSQPGLIWRSLIEWSTGRRLIRRPAASITCAPPSPPTRIDPRVYQAGNEACGAHAARTRSKAGVTEPLAQVARTDRTSLAEPGSDSIAA